MKEKNSTNFPISSYDFNPRFLQREIRVPTGCGKNDGACTRRKNNCI